MARRGAIVLGGGKVQREDWKLGGIWMRKIFREEVAAAVCCGKKGKKPSLPSF
jgi:hypothetical protein